MSQAVNPNYVDDTSSVPMWAMAGAAIVLFAGLLYFGRVDRTPNYGTLLPPGRDLPEIQAAGWINGEGESTKSLEGQVVVLEVWAPACPVCWKLAPELIKVHNKYADEGVVFVGLTSRDESLLDEMIDFVDRNNITWENGYGAGKTIRELGVRSLPALWVVGRDGKIVWNHKSEEPFLKALDRAVNSPVAQ